MVQLQQTQTSQYSRLWYVVFSENIGNIPWWQKQVLKLYPPEFGHVSLISPLTEYHALVIEPLNHSIHIELREFPHSIAKEVARIAQTNPVLAHITQPESARHFTNLVPSCVSVSKAVMGIPCLAVTPKGLHDYLLKQGALRL